LASFACCCAAYSAACLALLCPSLHTYPAATHFTLCSLMHLRRASGSFTRHGLGIEERLPRLFVRAFTCVGSQEPPSRCVRSLSALLPPVLPVLAWCHVCLFSLFSPCVLHTVFMLTSSIYFNRAAVPGKGPWQHIWREDRALLWPPFCFFLLLQRAGASTCLR